MLTDIFSYRYKDFSIWKGFSETEKRLLNQLFGVVKEAIPYYDTNGNEIKDNVKKWKSLHDGLSRELGIDELFKRYYSYTTKNHLGQSVPMSGFFGWDYVCENFVKSSCPIDCLDFDRFIKERISFIELAMRNRYEELEIINANLPKSIIDAKILDEAHKRRTQIPRNTVDSVKEWNRKQNDTYLAQVEEINERFRRVKIPLALHNGFIQVSIDEVLEKNVAKPFWEVVADPLWKNVDIDMKEALDRRDSNSKDPAFFAAKALESAIKIISDQRGWSSGTENGASNYIDNLASKKNGKYIEPWEADILRDYFRKVRNTLGHGPGSSPMPTLSTPQTDWAIETAMSWIRTLVRRL